jgi:hypothetical protein
MMIWTPEKFRDVKNDSKEADGAIGLGQTRVTRQFLALQPRPYRAASQPYETLDMVYCL